MDPGFELVLSNLERKEALQMALQVFWLQGGTCGGDTWSLFNGESPNIIEFINSFDIKILWHYTIK